MKSDDDLLYDLFDAIRDLRTAYRRFSEAKPTVVDASIAADRRLHRVFALLDNPQIVQNLNGKIAKVKAKDDPSQLKAEYAGKISETLITERKLLSHLGMSRKDAEEFLTKHYHAEWHGFGKIESVEDLKSLLMSAHRDYIRIIQASRDEAQNRQDATALAHSNARKVKKAKKRNGHRAAYSAVFGVGVIAVNALGKVFPISYAIGGTALMQSGRDFIDYLHGDDD